MKILVSACLVGLHTQWNGERSTIDELVEWVRAGRAVFLCPEQLGGLSTPRDPAEIEPGKTARDVLAGEARVLSRTGRDVTEPFARGAQETLAFCLEAGIETAIFGPKPLLRVESDLRWDVWRGAPAGPGDDCRVVGAERDPGLQ